MAQRSGTIWDSYRILAYNFGRMYVNVDWVSSNGKLTFTARPGKKQDGSYIYPNWDRNGTYGHNPSYLKLVVTDTKGDDYSSFKQWMRGGGAGEYTDPYLSGLTDITAAFPKVETPSIVGVYHVRIGQCDSTGNLHASESTPQDADRKLNVLPEIYIKDGGIKYPIIDIKVNVNGTAVDIVDVQVKST